MSNKNPESLLAWMEEKKEDKDNVHQQRLESDRTAVTLMTIHGSKGLQFPIGVLPRPFCEIAKAQP